MSAKQDPLSYNTARKYRECPHLLEVPEATDDELRIMSYPNGEAEERAADMKIAQMCLMIRLAKARADGLPTTGE